MVATYLQPPVRERVAGGESSAVQLQLLGGFQLCDRGAVLDLPSSAARLVAFLAIRTQPVERSYAANCLWMDKPECRAQANLRSCLWRLRQSSDMTVEGSATHLWLAPTVAVDLHELRGVARRLMEGADVDVHAISSDLFCSELLPAWYDDFVELEREQLRQLRLHALETLALQLLRTGDRFRALSLALTAVACDPLRESAHRLVIAIHLDEGNVSEALRQYGLLTTILRRELEIAPSAVARDMVSTWL
jgi:DNA-binding SARP family transcriptional activator